MQGPGSRPRSAVLLVLACALAGCSDDGAGKESSEPGGAASETRGDGEPCVAEGWSCDQAPCCTGSSCVQGAEGRGVCIRTCTRNSDCSTSCCAPSGDADLQICSPASACCGTRGQRCGAEDGSCCGGFRCTRFGEEPSSCREVCSSDAECGDGCCLAITGSDHSVCAEPQYCFTPASPCAELGAPCEGVGCCGDAVCVARTGSGDYVCQPTCTHDGDCATGCCVDIRGADYRACMDAALCG